MNGLLLIVTAALAAAAAPAAPAQQACCPAVSNFPPLQAAQFPQSSRFPVQQLYGAPSPIIYGRPPTVVGPMPQVFYGIPQRIQTQQPSIPYQQYSAPTYSLPAYQAPVVMPYRVPYYPQPIQVCPPAYYGRPVVAMPAPAGCTSCPVKKLASVGNYCIYRMACCGGAKSHTYTYKCTTPVLTCFGSMCSPLPIGTPGPLVDDFTKVTNSTPTTPYLNCATTLVGWAKVGSGASTRYFKLFRVTDEYGKNWRWGFEVVSLPASPVPPAVTATLAADSPNWPSTGTDQVNVLTPSAQVDGSIAPFEVLAE